MTLTAPHAFDPKKRIEVFLRAVAIFTRKFQRYWRTKLPEGMRPWWHRAFEWTPGNDGHGHPHAHFWLLCPFLDRTVIGALWADAVRDAGHGERDDARIIFDVRKIHTRPEDFQRELLKGADAIKLARFNVGSAGEDVVAYAVPWSLQDAVDGNRIPPRIAADVFEAFEGKRLTQGSKGLFAAREPCACGACGSLSSFRLRRIDSVAAANADSSAAIRTAAREAHPTDVGAASARSWPPSDHGM